MTVLRQLIETLKQATSMPELPDAHTNETLAWGDYRMAHVALEVFEPTVDVSGQQVLDVGCGLGGKTVYYAEQGAQLVVGLETSKARAHVARALANQHPAGTKVQIIVGDAARLPFRADLFDLLISIDTWEHLHAPILALCECERVVQPGGTVLISAMPYYSPWGSHAWYWLPLPWLPSLLPRRILFFLVSQIELYRQINAHLSTAVQMDWASPDDPAHTRQLTVAALKRSLSFCGLVILHFEILPVGARYSGVIARLVRVLIRFPLLRELLAGLVVVVMRKPLPGE